MVIWSGKGNLLGLFGVILYGIIYLLFKVEEEIGGMIAIFGTATLNLLWGHKFWNEEDSLFFIRMKYWSIVLIIIGVIFSVSVYNAR